jgi:hypothetical protein
VVLRGGDGKPNYDSVSVTLAEKELTKPKITITYGRLQPCQLQQRPCFTTFGHG